MIQLRGSAVAAGEPLVGGDDLAVVPDRDLPRADLGAHPHPGEAGGDRVAVLADRHHRLGVHAWARLLGSRVRLGREIGEQPALALQHLPDRLTATDDRALQVREAGRLQAAVQLGQRLHLRHRNQVTTAKPPDLSLDSSLLVGPLLAGEAEGGFEAVVGAKGDKAIGLDPASAFHHLGHRGLQVVVADQAEGAVEELQGGDVALEEGLLGLGLKRRDVGGARVAGAHQEQVDLLRLPAHDHLCLAPVDLGFHAGLGDQRHAGLDLTDLASFGGHVAADLAFGDIGAVLFEQALPDTAGGMALLARRLLVFAQPLVDDRPVGAELRCRAALGLSLGRWDRRFQGLPDGAAVHAVAACQLTDRQPRLRVIAPDLLELLHSCHSLPTSASRAR